MASQDAEQVVLRAVDGLDELRCCAVRLLELDHVHELLVDVHARDLLAPLGEAVLQELLDVARVPGHADVEADRADDVAVELAITEIVVLK